MNPHTDPTFQLFESTVAGMGGTQAPSPALSMQLGKAAQTEGPFFRPIGTVSIAEARKRHSAQTFGALNAASLSELLSLSMFDSDTPGARPYPAAGALYAVHMYLAAFNVEGLSSGLHYVRWSDGTLEQMDDAQSVQALRDEALVQDGKEDIPLLALLIADTRNAHIKYHDRATRFAMIETGALLQTLYLAGAKLGVGICGLGAIADRPALRLCRVQPSHQVFLGCGVAIGGGACTPAIKH